MNIKPIKTKKDYKEALNKIESIWNAKPRTSNNELLEVLSILVEKYEADHFPILPPDPVEAIKFRMEQVGLEKKDIAKIIGANRATEILQRKRKLTLPMIRSLHATLHIPTDSLIG